MATADELKYWIGFSRVPGIGRVRLYALREHFSSLADAWESSPSELKRAGLDSRSAEALIALRPGISLDAEIEKLQRHNTKALTCEDPSYPMRLKEIYDYPPVLYVRGSLLLQDQPCIAVVGTRRSSMYGRQVTQEIVADLARSNILIVSGLARGIDSVAHRTALEVGGETIAVFASGLDIVYPAENAKLAQAIMERGAVVSEYPLGTKPRAENFPCRNRLMSGLSLGVLVIEAGESSGALITASQALEQNREVFAVPGSILSTTSKGTNRLIQEGAKLVRNCADILEELNLTMATEQLEMREFLAANDIESLVLRQLGSEPSHIDEICRCSGLAVPQVSSTLAVLELKGVARQVGNMNYVLAHRVKIA